MSGWMLQYHSVMANGIFYITVQPLRNYSEAAPKSSLECLIAILELKTFDMHIAYQLMIKNFKSICLSIDCY